MNVKTFGVWAMMVFAPMLYAAAALVLLIDPLPGWAKWLAVALLAERAVSLVLKMGESRKKIRVEFGV